MLPAGSICEIERIAKTSSSEVLGARSATIVSAAIASGSWSLPKAEMAPLRFQYRAFEV